MNNKGSAYCVGREVTILNAKNQRINNFLLPNGYTPISNFTYTEKTMNLVVTTTSSGPKNPKIMIYSYSGHLMGVKNA